MDKFYITRYQELHNFKTARKGVIQVILKRSKLPFQVYGVSHLLSLIPPYTAVPKLSLHQMILTHLNVILKLCIKFNN